MEIGCYISLISFWPSGSKYQVLYFAYVEKNTLTFFSNN